MGYSKEQLAQIGLVAFTMIGTLLLSVFNRPSTPFAAVGITALLLLRFGEIASLTLKAFGVEAAITRAKLAAEGADKAVQEAEQAIKSLKALSKSLSLASLMQAGITGLKQKGSIDAMLILGKIVLQDLKGVGYTATEIEETMRPFRQAIVGSMLSEALAAVPSGQGSVIAEQVMSIFGGSPTDFDLEKVRTLFTEQGATDDAMNWLNKIEIVLKQDDVGVLLTNG